MVAAGGLVTVFGIFPVSLRQSQYSRSDMTESAFASSLLQALAGNIRMIDDISVWNEPKEFWKAAVAGTGLPTAISDADNGASAVYALHQKALKGDWTDRANGKPGKALSPMATYVAHDYSPSDDENIWYIAAERENKEQNPKPSIEKLIQPAQYLIRFACVRRTARQATGVRNQRTRALPTSEVVAEPVGKWAKAGRDARVAVLPNVYVISVVSTDRYFPDVFIREPVFSQEFTFIHRP